jgi:hypothetical protein
LKAVVFEKGDVLHRGLDAKDVAELVIQLDRSHAHGVPDTSAFDAHVVTVAHLILVVAVEFLAQKGGDVVGLDRVDGGSSQVPMNGLQVRLPPKHDVGGVFGFVQAPVIRLFDRFENRAVLIRKLVQLAV